MTDSKKKLIAQNSTFVCDWKKIVDNMYMVSFTDDENYSGEDWDVVPYEHNSEYVKENYIKHLMYIFIPEDFFVVEPNFNTPDSDYTKNDFKFSKVPFMSLVYFPLLRERAQYEIQQASFDSIYHLSVAMNLYLNDGIKLLIDKLEKLNFMFGLEKDNEKINYFIY